MERNDIEYFARRERHEREWAERSADQSVRKVHQTLAEQYAARLQDMLGQPEQTA